MQTTLGLHRRPAWELLREHVANSLLPPEAPTLDDTQPKNEEDLPLLWTPNPGAQTLAFNSQAQELYYGGAAGGGKSHLLIGLAVTKHRATIIFRREYTQLRGPDGLIQKAKEIIPITRGHFAGADGFRDIDGLRALEFGSVQYEDDKNKYKGRGHDLKGFDEITEFTESQFRFLIGWLRTSIQGQRCRIVCTFNPPTTSEGTWVLKYLAPWLDDRHPNPARPGELRWYATNGKGDDVEVAGPEPLVIDDEIRTPRSRTFIPARVEDNPFYMATGYDKTLESLPEPLRSQLRWGSFKTVASDHPWQVIPTAWVQAAQNRWTEDPPEGDWTQFGNDPSRGGQDKFVVAARKGYWVAPLVKHAGFEADDGIKGAALLFKDMAGRKDVTVCIDVIGTAGGSVYDQAGQLGLSALAMNGSEKSEKTDKSGKLHFYNKRAEWHWNMREILDPNSGFDVMLPPDRELLGDLCAPRWSPTPRGIKIEEKADIKKRIGRSPDCGEAVLYAFAEPEMNAWVEYAKQVHKEKLEREAAQAKDKAR